MEQRVLDSKILREQMVLFEESFGTCLRWRIDVHTDGRVVRSWAREYYTMILRFWPQGGVTGVLYDAHQDIRGVSGDSGDVFGSWNETRIRLFVIFRGRYNPDVSPYCVMKIEGNWSDIGENETENGKEKVHTPGRYSEVREGSMIFTDYDGDTNFDEGKEVIVTRGTCTIKCVGNFEDMVKELKEEGNRLLNKEHYSMSKSIKNFLRSLPEDDHMFDFKIICSDGKEVKSNKFILASQSKYFEGLFRKENCDSVKLDYQGAFVKACINFLHTEEIEISGDNVQDLLVTANYLLIDELVERTISHIIGKLDATNCVDILKFGVQFNFSKLVDTATNGICYNLDSLDDDTVMQIPLQIFKSILTNDNVCLRSSSKVILAHSEKKKKLGIIVEKYCHKSNQPEEKEALHNLVDQLPAKKFFFSFKNQGKIGENISPTNFYFIGQGKKLIQKLTILTSESLMQVHDVVNDTWGAAFKKMVSGLTLEWTDGTVDKVGEGGIEAIHEIPKGEHLSLVTGFYGPRYVKELILVLSNGEQLGGPVINEVEKYRDDDEPTMLCFPLLGVPRNLNLFNSFVDGVTGRVEEVEGQGITRLVGLQFHYAMIQDQEEMENNPWSETMQAVTARNL